jgi:hypothetical protein
MLYYCSKKGFYLPLSKVHSVSLYIELLGMPACLISQTQFCLYHLGAGSTVPAIPTSNLNSRLPWAPGVVGGNNLPLSSSWNIHR